jgi:cold shock CspA family protein
MEMPLELCYREVEKTEALESHVREKAAKLEKLHGNVISCQVALERPHRSRAAGNPYRVRVVVRVPPEQEIVIARNPGEPAGDDTVTGAVNEVFETVYRRLRKLGEIQRREVKRHPQQEANAVVAKVFEDRGYGFLETADGREVYFHENSVLEDKFKGLKQGDTVRYVEQEGEKGPQASTVRVVNRRRL